MPESPTPRESRSIFPAMEEALMASWKKQDVFHRSIEERSEKKGYVFYDGPPFATGLPHYGHLLQSAIKDAVGRYWTMKGYRVPRVWGWDCHGLPIENLIEKELNIGSKKEIEAYGIDKFNDACHMSVLKYEREWGKYIDRLGRWVDFEDSYKTMDNNYIESVWWVFSELAKKNLVYKDVRVSLYCPRCSTPLSNFEVAMGNSYEDHDDPAIFIKFAVEGEEKTFFIAWTTTPWSLPGNSGLAIHPDLMYVAVKVEDTGETLIFAESRQPEVLKQYYPLNDEAVRFEVIKRWKGSELVGKRYAPIYAHATDDARAFRVVAGMHVSADDGTGIVHTAPAFGEEDLEMHREHGLPVLDTVNDEGVMTAEYAPGKGLPRHEANPHIIEDLKARGLLYREESVNHSVPICWRCNTLLLYKAQPAWFVNVTSLREKIKKTADKINWHPEHFKEGRFGKGLDTAPDWNVSRTRFWGSPLPVWECECGERTIIGSIAELKKRAVSTTWPEKMDLHRPVIDGIALTCPCGKEQHRIPEVFDCWFESGSMPYASCHYPFEHRSWFDDHFPADFIAEAQDQTRGWFYVMHILATALFGKPAFKHVIVTGMVLAEDGKKMSKRLKNYPDPWYLLETYGADALRYYLLTSSVVEADALSFVEKDLASMQRGFMNLLWNVKQFYATYAGDSVQITKPVSTHVLDRWIHSRFQQLLKEVTESMDDYTITKATRPLREFVDDLSTWWLRRSRERMKQEGDFDRADALRTLKEMLLELSKVMAPFTPFLAEQMYLDLGGMKTSVHLEAWPKVQDRVIDERLVQDMVLVRSIVSRAHELRAEHKLAVRQALAKLTVTFNVKADAERLSRQRELLTLIRDEVNVEAVELTVKEGGDYWTVELDTVITPVLKRKGLRREFARFVMNLRKEAECMPNDEISVIADVAPSVREAIEENTEEVKRDIKAKDIAFGTVPDETRHTEVKMDGASGMIGIHRQ